MISSKLTTKAQTTIPQAVRNALALQPGDELAYTIESGRVIVTRLAPPPATDDPFAAFAEWDSQADAEVNASL
jgi:antitoxin PrlF